MSRVRRSGGWRAQMGAAWAAGAALAMAVVAAASCDGAPQPPDETEAPKPLTAVERGAELFESPSLSASPFNPYACSTCHFPGATPPDDRIRTGGSLAGVIDRPTYWGGAEVDLLRAVNHCLSFFMLQDEPWTGQEADAQALYAYLETLSGEAAAVPFTVVKLPVDLPNGDGGRGLGVYQRACATCHGAVHTGMGKLVDYAPVLPEEALEIHPSPEYTDEERRLVFVFRIRHGGFMGHHGQMPLFSTEALSDGDVSDLLAVFFPE